VTGERRRRGLPPDAAVRSGVTAELEPAYLAAMRAAAESLSAGDLERALAQAEALLALHPEAPGPLAVRCEAHLRAGRMLAARQACEAALAGWDETVRGHLWLGVVEAQANHRDEAVRHLERALELEPEQEATWRTLAEYQRRWRRTEALDDLRRRYRERFGRALE